MTLALVGAAGGVAGPTPIVLALLAVVAVATALAVVLHRNLVVEALFLVLHLLTIAGLYVLLGAYFFAALQVIIYAGAIVVLIVFVIMLLNLGREAQGGPGTASLTLALTLGVLLTLLLVRAARSFAPAAGAAVALPPEPNWGGVAALADALFGAYFFPFEVVSLVLVAAMVGAILFAKRRLEG